MGFLLSVMWAVLVGISLVISTGSLAATHSACSTNHCVTAKSTTCVLRKIGGSWVRICQ